MNALNNLIIEGNLTNGKREGNAFKFLIVANRFYKGKQLETSFFDVEAYGLLANDCEQQFQKGRGVSIVGRLKQMESKVVIIAEHVEFKK